MKKLTNYEIAVKDRLSELEKKELQLREVVKAIRSERRALQKHLDAYHHASDPFLPLEDERQEQEDKKNASQKGS